MEGPLSSNAVELRRRTLNENKSKAVQGGSTDLIGTPVKNRNATLIRQPRPVSPCSAPVQPL